MTAAGPNDAEPDLALPGGGAMPGFLTTPATEFAPASRGLTGLASSGRELEDVFPPAPPDILLLELVVLEIDGRDRCAAILLTAAVGPFPCVAAVVPGAIDDALLLAAALGGRFSGVPGAALLPMAVGVLLMPGGGVGVDVVFPAAAVAAVSLTPVAEGTFLSAGAESPPLVGRSGGFCSPVPVVLLRVSEPGPGPATLAVPDEMLDTGRRAGPLMLGVVFLRPSRKERAGVGEVTAAALGGRPVAAASSDIILLVLGFTSYLRGVVL